MYIFNITVYSFTCVRGDGEIICWTFFYYSFPLSALWILFLVSTEPEKDKVKLGKSKKYGQNITEKGTGHRKKVFYYN